MNMMKNIKYCVLKGKEKEKKTEEKRNKNVSNIKRLVRLKSYILYLEQFKMEYNIRTIQWHIKNRKETK